MESGRVFKGEALHKLSASTRCEALECALSTTTGMEYLHVKRLTQAPAHIAHLSKSSATPHLHGTPHQSVALNLGELI